MMEHRFKVFGMAFAELGFTLRSGAADGADAAFEAGCDKVWGRKEIYLPWEDFNEHESNLFTPTPEAFELAEEYYGENWIYLKPPTQKFMARNMHQVTGITLDEPSKFVVCYTPDGCNDMEHRRRKTGGTGQAIAYGSDIGVPVFNVKNHDDIAHLFNFVKTLLQETPSE